jgi:hypothetical protein
MNCGVALMLSLGVARYGYRESPLERYAYEMQMEFRYGIYRRSLVSNVRERAELAWRDSAENW